MDSYWHSISFGKTNRKKKLSCIPLGRLIFSFVVINKALDFHFNTSPWFKTLHNFMGSTLIIYQFFFIALISMFSKTGELIKKKAF